MTVHSIGKGLILLLFSVLLVACDNSNGDGTPVNPLILLNEAAVLEGDSGFTPLPFELQSPVAQSVAYRTYNITAAAGSDYVATSGQLDFAANEVKTVVVQVIGDTRVEATEVFGLEITYPDGTRSRFEGTIINDDFPVVSVEDRSITEGDQGTRLLEFTLQLEQKTVDPYRVQVSTRDQPVDHGIAEPGVDYEPIDEIVEIPAGAQKVIVPVVIYGDLVIQPDLTFILDVHNLDGELLDSATGTILNDDGPGFNAPFVFLSDVEEEEGSAGEVTDFEFTATLSEPASFVYEMNYEVIITENDTATLGEDLLPQSGILSFAPGETEKSIIIEVLGDDKFEADETFTLVLNTGTGFEFARATGTIINDDLPIVNVDDVADLEGDSGDLTAFTFTVSLAEPPPINITLEYRTQAGTAKTGIDFNLTSGQLIFTPDNFSQTVDVIVIGNNVYEPDKIFYLNIRKDKDGDVLATGTGTIINDDLPTLNVSVAGGPEKLEGGPGQIKEVTIDAFLNQVALSQTDFYFKTFDGSATGGDAPGSGIDFEHNEGQVRFLSNTNTPEQPVTVSIYGDALFEPDENFFVRFFANQSDATANINELAVAEVIILNDDFISLELSPATLEVVEGQPEPGDTTTSRALTDLVNPADAPEILVSGAIIEHDFDIAIDVLDWLDTDTHDLNLNASPLIISVPAGNYYNAPQSFAIEGINIISDSLVENDESVKLGITAATFNDPAVIAGASTELLLTIINDDVLQVQFDNTGPVQDTENDPQNTPRIEVINALASNYNPAGPGGAPLELEISLDNLTSTASNADFDTMPLTIDLYDLSAGGITAGQTFDVIEVIEDGLIEAPETAFLQMASLSALIEVNPTASEAEYILLSSARLTINFTEPNYSYTGGIAPQEDERVALRIEGGIVNADSPALSVSFLLVDDSAFEDVDYESGSNIMILPEGDYTQAGGIVLTFSDDQLATIPNAIVEADKHFGVELIAPSMPLSDYLLIGPEKDTTVTIISNATLKVEFEADYYQGYENLANNLPRVVVTGQTNVSVDIPIIVGNLNDEDYPAANPGDFTLNTLTIPGNHSGTVSYAIDLELNNNNTAEFNRTLPLELAPGLDDPLELGTRTTTLYRILDDDQALMVHGSNSSYCANDADGGIECDDTADGYDLQDAKLSQTALSVSNRREADFNGDEDDVWVCVDDDLTGLSWAFQKDPPTSVNTNQLNTRLANTGNLCSRSDWRLPVLPELLNLLDFSNALGLLDATVFDNVDTSATSYYWTGTNNASSQPWTLSFHDGHLRAGVAPNNNNKILLVSSSAAVQLQENSGEAAYACASPGTDLPAEAMTDHRFIVDGPSDEEIITDNLTGLTWSSRSLEVDFNTQDWGVALQLASDESFGGSNDWRAPTIKELLSLLYFGCDTLAGTRDDLRLPPHFLPKLDGGGEPLLLMSATPVSAGPGGDLNIWVVNLDPDNPADLLETADPVTYIEKMQIFLVKD